jgi:hypothetical protein
MANILASFCKNRNGAERKKKIYEKKNLKLKISWHCSLKAFKFRRHCMIVPVSEDRSVIVDSVTVDNSTMIGMDELQIDISFVWNRHPDPVG